MYQVQEHVRSCQNSCLENFQLIARNFIHSSNISLTAEKELKYLRKENRKTMFVAVAIVLLMFILYSLFFS